ncbi:hypothetical protein VMCG_09611 [Cytospora schulzeri]|uniref:Uncharacterized protein n=1 Tax=Cytospora schulzeri TaxID=448051 RepID=A0A423VJF2_9PEZI|nr:hypothetical protein VMCG_09611 [Valsa malicola]
MASDQNANATGSGASRQAPVDQFSVGASSLRQGTETGPPSPHPHNPFSVSAPERRGGGQRGTPHRGRGNWFRGGSHHRGGRGQRGVPHRGRVNWFGGERRGHNTANENMRGTDTRLQQRVLGKRTRDDSQSEEGDVGSLMKRVNFTGQATSRRLESDQVVVERGVFGDITRVKAADPNGPKHFSMSSIMTPGATDVIFNARQIEGWNAVMDTTRGYLDQGFEDFSLTIKPLAARRSNWDRFDERNDGSNARVIEELSDDSDSESLRCEACEATSHQTKNCPIPSNFGDTIIDPFCNLSIKAQAKGNKDHHSLDGKRATHPRYKGVLLYCPMLIAFERREVANYLVRLFGTLVEGRRRMPPIRVFKEEYCFIKIAIDVSDAYCKGEMPRALGGVWPYTKQDALKYRHMLTEFDMRRWEAMPKGELEGMDWQVIKREYEAGRIPKQIHVSKPEPVFAGPMDHTGDVHMEDVQETDMAGRSNVTATSTKATVGGHTGGILDELSGKLGGDQSDAGRTEATATSTKVIVGAHTGGILDELGGKLGGDPSDAGSSSMPVPTGDGGDALAKQQTLDAVIDQAFPTGTPEEHSDEGLTEMLANEPDGEAYSEVDEIGYSDDEGISKK